MDNAYITMRAFVDSNEINDIARGFYDRINAYSNKIFGLTGRIEEIDKDIKEIGKKLSNDFGDLIASHEAMLEQAQSIRDDCQQQEYFYTQNIKSNEAKEGAEAKIA